LVVNHHLGRSAGEHLSGELCVADVFAKVIDGVEE
jgi:hypothetical protein